MATGLIMPTLPADLQQSRHFLPTNMHDDESSPGNTYNSPGHYRPHHYTYTRSQSYPVSPAPPVSPIDTFALVKNPLCSDPPSPYVQQYQFRGIPMYMPAVLRRCDEFPPTMIARCRTAGSTSSSGSDSTLKRASNVLMSIPGLSVLGHHLARRSTSETSKTLEGNWNLDKFPEVAGMPTRKHWKPDSEASICDDPGCRRTFNCFVRRHHCRKCGDIFCDWHSSAALPLDENAEFNPRAEPSRSCNYCFNQAKSQHQRTDSQSSGSTMDDIPTPTTPIKAPLVPGVTPSDKPEATVSTSREWNWSTF